MLVEGGEVDSTIHEDGGVGVVIVAKGLIDDDGDVKDSSLVVDLGGDSPAGRRGRGRNNRILPLQ